MGSCRIVAIMIKIPYLEKKRSSIDSTTPTDEEHTSTSNACMKHTDSFKVIFMLYATLIFVTKYLANEIGAE